MIWLTGDIHGSHTINKLASSNFPEGKNLTKDDYVIILGDFGLLWTKDRNPEERFWTDWLTEKPWTTIVVPGNHENWDRIYELPIIEKFGAPIREYNDSIYLMKRGEIYTLEGETFFNMGGAYSIDRNQRILNKSWWEAEVPTTKEFEHGLKNLEEIGWEVDYILGHNTSNYAVDKMFNPRWKIADPVSAFFDAVVDKTSFTNFYFGHWHKDIKSGKYRVLYHDIIRLGD